MKALMQDLGPDFKFPEWKCADLTLAHVCCCMPGTYKQKHDGGTA